MLGIEDKSVVLVYFLCVASALLCVAYGLIMRNKGDEEVGPDDVKWVNEEKKVEDNL